MVNNCTNAHGNKGESTSVAYDNDHYNTYSGKLLTSDQHKAFFELLQQSRTFQSYSQCMNKINYIHIKLPNGFTISTSLSRTTVFC